MQNLIFKLEYDTYHSLLLNDYSSMVDNVELLNSIKQLVKNERIIVQLFIANELNSVLAYDKTKDIVYEIGI